MSVPIRTRVHHDRRPRWGLYGVFWAALAGGLVWLFLGSSLWAVTDVQVSGATSVGDATIAQAVRGLLSQRRLYVLQPLRNIFLMDAAAIGDFVKEQYAAVGQTVVTKKYPHTLSIAVTERVAIGTWCKGEDCQFFDATGVRWGQAIRSSGPLLLLVRDERTDTPELEPMMFQNMLAAVGGLPKLGLAARTITLPDAEPGGIRIKTSKGYELYLDALGDVDDQMDVLAVFLSDRAKDAAFSPTYIDLRTPGRVYYK